MARLLVLSHIPMIPLSFGGARRVAALVRIASQIFDEVALVAVFGSAQGTEGEWREGNVMITQTRALRPRRGSSLVQSFLWGQPQYWKQASDLRWRDFDLVQIELPYMWKVPQSLGIPFILDEHNLDWEVLRQEARFRRRESVARNLFWLYAGWRLRRIEYQALTHARSVLFSSRSEMDEAKSSTRGRIQRAEVIPNCVDRDMLEDYTSESSLPTVLFLGYLNWFPNEDALHLIVKEIAPALPGGIRIRVVGPGSLQLFDLPANVEMVGQVPEPKVEIRRAWVCIAPLRYGGGTKFKMVEYFAAGKPVVASSKAIEGLEVTHGRDLVVEDDFGKYPAHIVNLIADRERARALGRNARALAEQRYLWDLYDTRMKKVYASLM